MQAVRSMICLVGCLTFPSFGVAADEPTVAKSVSAIETTGENRLKTDAWRPWQQGFDRRGEVFVCDNGSDTQVQRGVSQTVVLDQTVPEPIVATAESRCEGVDG